MLSDGVSIVLRAVFGWDWEIGRVGGGCGGGGGSWGGIEGLVRWVGMGEMGLGGAGVRALWGGVWGKGGWGREWRAYFSQLVVCRDGE